MIQSTVRRLQFWGNFYTHLPTYPLSLKMHIFLAATQKHTCILVQIEGVLPLLETQWQGYAVNLPNTVAHQECFLLCSTLYNHTGASSLTSVNSKWYYFKSCCTCETQTLTFVSGKSSYFFVKTQILAFFRTLTIAQAEYFQYLPRNRTTKYIQCAHLLRETCQL